MNPVKSASIFVDPKDFSVTLLDASSWKSTWYVRLPRTLENCNTLSRLILELAGHSSISRHDVHPLWVYFFYYETNLVLADFEKFFAFTPNVIPAQPVPSESAS